MRKLLAASLLAVSSPATAMANDNPFGYSNDTGITKKGEYEVQQSVTIRSGLDQGSGFDRDYRGYDFQTQLEWGISDVEHLDFQVGESCLRSPAFKGFRFDGLNVEYKHLIRDGEKGGWGAAWVAALGYSQLDSSSGALRTETRYAGRLLLQNEFGARRAWCYVTNLTAGLARNAIETAGQVEWSQGLAYRPDDHWAYGVETVADGTWTRFRNFDNSSLRVGPTLAYKTGDFSVSLTYLWQVSGAPATDNGRNLADTCRSEGRLLLSFGF